MNEGIHPDIPEATYHADPCEAPSLSNSIARMLLSRSPMHAWHAHPRLNPAYEPRDGNAAMDAGTIIHKILLGRGSAIEVVDAPDWRTKAAKEARDAARAAGHTPVLVGDLSDIHDAAKAIRSRIKTTTEGAMLFEPGIPEATLIWREGPIWCRARADYLLNDPRLPILDLKTTKLSANPEQWQKRLVSDYCFQDAFYRRGLTKLRRVTPPMRFIVAEQDAPHGVAVMCSDPSLAAYAEHQVERAISMWTRCIMSNEWPGYAPQTAHVAAPSWLLSQMEDQMFLEDAA